MAYTLALASLLATLLRMGKATRLFPAILVPLLAGVTDEFENCLMLRLLLGPAPTISIAKAASVASRVKWLLVVASVVLVVVAGLAAAAEKLPGGVARRGPRHPRHVTGGKAPPVGR